MDGGGTVVLMTSAARGGAGVLSYGGCGVRSSQVVASLYWFLPA